MAFYVVVLVAAMSCSTSAQGFSQFSVSADESASWIRYVTPMPKEIRIDSRVVVPPGSIKVSSAESQETLVSQVAKELRDAIGPEAVAMPSDLKQFSISLELGGPDAEPLRDLKNSNQAYRIIPGAGGLRLIALEPRGLYYASKTLKQLVKAKATAEFVQMPLVTVNDWPDLEKRGLWGADSHVWIPWMSDRKLNLISHISYLEVDSSGRGHARHKSGREPLSQEAPLQAVTPAPAVLHLEQVGSKGLFDAYPNLKAKGGKEDTICYSQPQIVDVLADWYVDLASLPGVEAVEQWLAENLGGQGGCRCPECSKTDRDLLELQVVLKALEKARTRKPGIKLVVMTTEETADNNARIFAALPKDVHVWYYHSLLTYSSSRIPMVTRDVADFAARGGWIGAVPSLCSNVNFPGPFTAPQFVRERINEFVDKRLSGLLAYPSPGMDITRFNVEAMAEWSWNAKGRSVREFAESWAVREGFADPKLFADWCETNGPVAWDIYGSCWPEYQKRRNPKRVSEALKTRQLLTLAEANTNSFRGPWGDFRTPGQFASNLDKAGKALELARQLSKPEYIAESRVVRGYMKSLNALWELNTIVTPDGIDIADRAEAKTHFQAYIAGLGEARDALMDWARSVVPRTSPEDLLDSPLKVIEELVGSMRKTASELGVRLDQP